MACDHETVIRNPSAPFGICSECSRQVVRKSGRWTLVVSEGWHNAPAFKLGYLAPKPNDPEIRHKRHDYGDQGPGIHRRDRPLDFSRPNWEGVPKEDG